MKTHRLARVAEAVREVASETILYELRDPRVKRVTVTRAEVSGDLQHAKVYVSVMGTPKEQELTLRGLRHAAGFVQSKLAARLQTRFTPVLQFVLDQGVKHSIEMTRLINEALAESSPRPALPESPPGADVPGGSSGAGPEEADDSPRPGAADGMAADPPSPSGLPDRLGRPGADL
jgi:ribosome-binding factor A